MIIAHYVLATKAYYYLHIVIRLTHKKIQIIRQSKDGKIIIMSPSLKTLHPPLSPGSFPAPPAPWVAYPQQLHLCSSISFHIFPVHYTQRMELTLYRATYRKIEKTHCSKSYCETYTYYNKVLNYKPL